jgi:hypothetical protein
MKLDRLAGTPLGELTAQLSWAPVAVQAAWRDHPAAALLRALNDRLNYSGPGEQVDASPQTFPSAAG